MSANNRRIRRIIVDLLYEYGAMTKEGMADLLTKKKSVRTVPSPHSLRNACAARLGYFPPIQIDAFIVFVRGKVICG